MKKKKPGPAKGTKFTDVKRSHVGECLFKARRARGLSQEELGTKTGISKRMIAHYEGDNGIPPLDSLSKIADVLNVTVSYLLGESTQKMIKDKISPKLRKHIEKIQKLPAGDQLAVFRMVDGLAAQNGNNKQ
jgi:transcriptional regulator with XRE-family HTH domain